VGGDRGSTVEVFSRCWWGATQAERKRRIPPTGKFSLPEKYAPLRAEYRNVTPKDVTTASVSQRGKSSAMADAPNQLPTFVRYRKNSRDVKRGKGNYSTLVGT